MAAQPNQVGKVEGEKGQSVAEYGVGVDGAMWCNVGGGTRYSKSSLKP
jgi:hypothetical protein